MDLNIYVIKVSLLVSIVEDLVSLGKFSLSRDVLQAKAGELDIRAYEFSGFFRRICDLVSYYDANMALLNHDNLAMLVKRVSAPFTQRTAPTPLRNTALTAL